MRKYGWITLFLLSIAVVAAFGIWLTLSAATPPRQQVIPEPQADVELDFMNSWGGLDGKADMLQQLLDEFMAENPGIKVNNESVYGDEFLPGIKTRFALGDEPDVFGLWPGSDIRNMIAAGKVADLTQMLNSDKEFKYSFNERMWQYVTANGRIYGLPVEIIFETLFVNLSMFDLYDVKVPETYDELLTAVKVFRANGVIPIAYNSEPEGSYLYQNMTVMLGGKQAVENPFQNGQISDCYIQAMYKMRELYELNAFPDNYYALTSDERNNLFINKKAAMIVQGSWFVSEIIEDSMTDVIPFPTLEKSDKVPSIVYGMGCGIFYASQKAMDDPAKNEAVQKLLKFMASKQSAALLAENTGMISNVNVLEYDISYNRLTQKGMDIVHKAQELVGPPDSFISRSVWESVIIEQFPYMLEQKISPEELWQTAIASGAQEQ